MTRTKNYWFTYSKKTPEGFSNVKGKIRHYTQITDLVIIEDSRIHHTKIKIRYCINSDKTINFNKTHEIICKYYPTLQEILLEQSFFQRDGGLFPYVKIIKSYSSDIDEFLNYEKIRKRGNKIKKLLDKKTKK